jgi:hypothetical protein
LSSLFSLLPTDTAPGHSLELFSCHLTSTATVTIVTNSETSAVNASAVIPGLLQVTSSVSSTCDKIHEKGNKRQLRKKPGTEINIAILEDSKGCNLQSDIKRDLNSMFTEPREDVWHGAACK